MSRPTVTVLVPTYREEAHLDATLASVEGQTYERIVEVLVVDGRSDDRTREIAAARGALVLDNPKRIQAAALNLGLAAARGEVIVRVDGHCVLAPDYVERCVGALEATGAAIVGGAMTPVADGWVQEGIAAAMSSPFGAGPARFHTGGSAGWVDTVYLGAFRRIDAETIGGYAEDVGVNEDAEFAIRMGQRGGVWFDPSIRSTYTPRSSYRALSRQFLRYGASRFATLRRHPSEVRLRQLAPAGLIAGLISPWRRWALCAYLTLIILGGARVRRGVRVSFYLSLPVMHFSWATGFIGAALRNVGVRYALFPQSTTPERMHAKSIRE